MKLKKVSTRMGVPLLATAALLCTSGWAAADRDRAARSLLEVRPLPGPTQIAGQPGNDLTAAHDPNQQFGGGVAQDLLFDNGGPDGSNGLSNFEGDLAGTPYDRTLADDFLIPGNGVAQIEMVEMSGVWFDGAGAPGPLDAIRVRVWEDDGTGTPVTPIDNTVCDQTVGFTAQNTGGVYFGRPEILYTAVLDAPCAVNCEQWYWVSIQPVGTTDNFFHLTSATGAANLTGEQVHLEYPDFGAPWPTPGFPTIFTDPYDVTFKLYGQDCSAEADCPWDFNDDGVVDGADLGQLLANWGPCQDCDDCPWDVTGDCVVDGADLGQLLANWGDCPEPPPPPTGACCIGETCDELTFSECNAAGGEFLGVGTDCEGDPCELDCGHPFAGDCCEPNPTPYCDDEECCELICGQDPFCCGDFGGNWDSACAAAANQQCEVCDEEPEGLCAGHCGGMAPEGCWCDAACEGFGDCCPDVCEDCPELPFCGDPPACQDCGCPGGAIPEGEPCGSDTNGGCNSTPPVFDFVNDGDVICGSVWAEAGTRDTDWFRVTVGSTGTVSGTVTSAAPQVVFIINANWADCSGVAVVGTIGHSVECTPGTASASGLSPGSEVVVFTATGNSDGSGIFDGYPCGSCDGGDWEYVLEISAP